ncbi:MAG TPA: cytochrome c biogenesis protein CcdA [Solirubrobacteraceae bacterium]|nr:cytochrome c biogenesis protein CcdA [Solirubrobacteraceae bacterium]
MLVLMLFAVVVGAGTAVSPCVLPVLPAMLSASGAGGTRRPLGIVIGLTTTFAITIIGIAKVVDGVGLGSDPLRDVAIVVLLVFGLALIVPRFGQVLERPLAVFSRLGPRTSGDGFASGLLVGGALGFVYTPCAGPILAAVISVSAASGSAVLVGLAYAFGTGLMLLALALGGRRILDRLRRGGRTLVVQRVLGVVMVATALVIATMLDVKLDELIARHIPNVNITAAIDDSGAVASRLSSIHPHKALVKSRGSAGTSSAADLPVGPAAPPFIGTEDWFNTAGGRPLTFAGLRGHVVLVDFWTYTCINCIRTLPYLEAWYRKYRSDGLVVIGVESPEFPFERDAGNLKAAIAQFGIRYPIVQDNNLDTFNEWGNEGWPSDFLIDARGRVRYADPYEGYYPQTEAAIRALLVAAGTKDLGADARPNHVITPSTETSPETYLGTARAEDWASGPFSGTHTYAAPTGVVALSGFAYGGTWTIAKQQALAGNNATITANVQGKHVYIVLSPPAQGVGHVGVLINGRVPNAGDAGSDVHDGYITVTGQRLYNIVSEPHDEDETITLSFSPGTSGYSFTFG